MKPIFYRTNNGDIVPFIKGLESDYNNAHAEKNLKTLRKIIPTRFGIASIQICADTTSFRVGVAGLFALFFGVSLANSAVNLVFPPNNSTNQDTVFLFDWETVSGATSYGLQVSTSSNLNTGPYLIDEGFLPPANSSIWVTTGLFQNVKYFWRVKSVGPNGVQWSNTWSFQTRSASTSNVNRSQTDIGIWYNAYTPLQGDGDQAFFPLRSDGTYNYFTFDEEAEIDHQIKEIANAKMDFLIYESTNGGFVSPLYTQNSNWDVYAERAKVVTQRIHNWNQTHSWKMRYVHAIGAHHKFVDASGNPIYMRADGQTNGSTDFGDCINQQAAVCLNQWVSNSSYGGSDTWYQLEGKPLLIVFIANQPVHGAYTKLYQYKKTPAYQSSAVAQFTIRFAGTGEAGEYGWPAFGNSYFTKQPALGTQINDEVEVVSPGYALTDTNENSWSRIYREGGTFCREKGWERVLANKKPRVLVISAFNDYLEETGIWPAIGRTGCAPGVCIDCVLPRCEKWLNASGVEDPTMYWSMTKGYIFRMRGLMTPINSLFSQ